MKVSSNKDRSMDSLLERRRIAGMATKGAWTGYFDDPDHMNGVVNCGIKHVTLVNYYDAIEIEKRVTLQDQLHNTMHIALNSPDVIIEDINEILDLRARSKMYENFIRNIVDLLHIKYEDNMEMYPKIFHTIQKLMENKTNIDA